MVAYPGCRKRAPASRRGRATRDAPQTRKSVEIEKKILFGRNELSYLLITNDLALKSVINELVFERKKTKSTPKKWPKTHLIRVLYPSS